MSVSTRKGLQRIAAWAAVLAMTVQPQLLSANEFLKSKLASGKKPVQSTIPHDVVLQDGGLLSGELVDAQGAPVALSPVSLQTGGKEIARVHTDQRGKFEVSSLQGGVYQIASTGHQGTYRFWAPNTAPPSAQQGLTLVSGKQVIRGQYGAGGNIFTDAGQWMADHPIITAGAIATAIAVPLALDDDDDPPPATP